jgi:hypothetical protein
MVDLLKDFVAPAVAATLGTGVGAWLAFFIERDKKRHITEDQRVTATNTALYALIRVWNTLEVYRRQEIEKQRNSADRWFLLRPTPLPTPTTFDAASLSYLFELGGEAPNLPMEVDLELGRYDSIYQVATERNRIHETDAQPAIEKAQQRPTTRPLQEQLVAMLGGGRVLMTLQGLTDDLINMTDNSLATIPKTAQKLREVAKCKYPKRKIIGFDGIEAIPAPHPKSII